MVSTHMTKATAAWVVLHSKLINLGWQDHSIKLALFEAYIRSVILHSSSVWG